jgi:predicted ribosome quality control (RQC) complex YloA/Tae2 family protein
MLEFLFDDIYKVYVGESAQDNWDLIDKASQNDLWFHLESFSSPHVIVTVDNPKIKIPKTVLKYAAQLCHEHSKYKLIKNIKVIWTEIKNVSKAIKVGSVYTKKTHTIKL